MSKPPNIQLQRIQDRIGLTQAQMADALGIKQGTWSKYRRGLLRFPPEKAKELLKIAMGHQLLIDLNHVYQDIPLPQEQQPASTTPIRAAA